jgi:predicted PurR-regulated permease PerM
MRPDKTPPGETQLRIIWFALTVLAITAVAAIGVGVIWGIGKFLNLLSPVLWPLAIALVLAYLLDPAVSWLEYKGLSRTSGIIIVFAVVVAVLTGVLANIIPKMTSEASDLASRIPGYATKAQQQVSAWAEHAARVANNFTAPPHSTNAPPAINSGPDQSDTVDTNSPTNSVASTANQNNVPQIHREIIASATSWTAKIVSSIGAWLLAQLAKATALIDVVVALILIPIYTFYFLREKRWIKAHWTDYLPIGNARVKHEVIFILDSINQYMIAFFRGQVLVSICSGILYTIGFLILGLDYAFLLGFFCMVMTMVPFLGSLISFIVAMVLTAMQFGDWFHPLMIFVIYTVVISLENFFYSPHIMGHRVGLHPLIIIVAVMVGITLLGGLLGGVLAIPLAAALRVILYRYFWKRPEPSP